MIMPHLTFQAACRDDDEALRQLLRDNPMQGGISVSFCREPSYFDACSVQGETADVFVGRDTRTGALAGVGARYGFPAFVNGEIRPLAYLADLRVQAAYRNGVHLRRAYDFLRQQHQKHPYAMYTSMILKDNQTALRTIAAARAGLPPYHAQGLVHTPMLLLAWQKPPIQAACTVRRATMQDWSQIVAFLNREHARFQFAPYYREADLFNHRLRGLNIDDIYLACRDDVIIGTLALWQQSAFRQIRVADYQGAWRWLRPIYNGLAAISPLTRLPEKGGILRCAYLALTAVEHDDLNVFRALLRHVYRDACGRGLHYLVASLHERHPLLPALDDYMKMDAGGYLFTVQFDDEMLALDGRVPFVEAAAL